MAVTPAGYISTALESVAETLANCAAFRTLMGAASASAARDLTYFQDCRELPVSPFAVVTVLPGSLVSVANRTYQHECTVSVYILWTEITDAGDTKNDRTLRQTNPFGDLLAQVAALINTGTTYPAAGAPGYVPPARLPDAEPYEGCWDATITFTWTI